MSTAAAEAGHTLARTDQRARLERVATAAAGIFTVTPRSYGEMASIAQQLYRSGLLSKNINSPEKAFAIIVAGAELGMPPMLALRSVGIIDGKIIVQADAQLGAFKRAGGRSSFQKLDKDGAVLYLKHPNGDEHTETFTWQMAIDAKLTGKDNYQKHRIAMMRSRAITAGLKSIGFEPVAGMYDPDEATHFAPPPVLESLEAQAGVAAEAGTAQRDIAEVENISEGERVQMSNDESNIGRCPLPGDLNGVRYDTRGEGDKYLVSDELLQKISDWAAGKAHVNKQLAADPAQSKGARAEAKETLDRMERYASDAEREIDRRSALDSAESEATPSQDEELARVVATPKQLETVGE